MISVFEGHAGGAPENSGNKGMEPFIAMMEEYCTGVINALDIKDQRIVRSLKTRKDEHIALIRNADKAVSLDMVGGLDSKFSPLLEQIRNYEHAGKLFYKFVRNKIKPALKGADDKSLLLIAEVLYMRGSRSGVELLGQKPKGNDQEPGL